jgi:hypothetical protein
MDTHAEVPPPSLPPEPEVRVVWELEALFEQHDADPSLQWGTCRWASASGGGSCVLCFVTVISVISIHQARLVDLRGPYAESDSAFLLEEAVRPL